MKKIVCFGLCFMIVLSSFVLCFADVGSPAVLPVSDVLNSGVLVNYSSGNSQYYRANLSPVYIAFYENNGTFYRLIFSDSSNAIVSYNRSDLDSSSSISLTSVYNGYYYVSSLSSEPLNYFVGSFSSPQDAIDSIASSVFNVTFDLTYLIDGSVSWISSLAQAAKNNGLLLFLVTVSMVGVGIGLFNRFRR